LAQGYNYVEAKVNGVKANCLIDTGATLTIVYSKLMNILSVPCNLDNFRPEIFTAAGTLLQTHERTNVRIEIQGFEILTEVVISEIDVDVILGLDFMKSQDVFIDVVNDSMTIRGKLCKLSCRGPIGSNRVGSCHVKLSGDRRPTCPMCPKTFKRGIYLKRHIWLQHGEQSDRVKGMKAEMPNYFETEDTVRYRRNQRIKTSPEQGRSHSKELMSKPLLYKYN
jgi:predicted aspartyl protease